MKTDVVPTNFIEEAIVADLREGVYEGVHTRLPPEPNGWLHIGHAKNIYINCGTARKFGGLCNLRFDDTNPAAEEAEFVGAIQKDIRWLGYEWNGGLFFGSDYFGQCYELAEKLIADGKAYVCDLTQEQMREYRGTLTEPGRNSPWRDRSVEENLDLFRRMRDGEFPNGARTLRAKIDMASGNINLRDPALYRIMHLAHHHVGDRWVIYPMYDFAHPIQDAIEGITHSMCALEYIDHRPLYDWVIEACGFPNHPRQIEYGKLNITRTVLSKRNLRALVESGFVDGWDDPRMATLAGLRRRGFPPEAILDFVERVGVARPDATAEVGLLEHCVRERLGVTAPRAMAVIDPLKIVLTNWPEGHTETLRMENHPDHPEWGERDVAFGRELYIEREDFMLDPPSKFFRLKPGGEVRLKGAYIIKCEEAVVNADGSVAELRCTVDMTSKSGGEGASRKVKGTLHWLSAQHCVAAEFRLYDYLLLEKADQPAEADIEAPEAAEATEATGGARPRSRLAPEIAARLNHASKVVAHGYVEPMLAQAEPLSAYQFLRVGYFCADQDGTPEAPVFNRTLGLRDTYAKEMSRPS